MVEKDKKGQYKKDRLTPKQRAFLAAYSETGNISQAAVMAKVARSRHYCWYEKNENYRKAFDEATEIAADRLEQEAWRRAVEGVSEPVFYQGKKVGTVQKYSNTLLIFLLKGAKPEKYKEKSAFEITGKGGGPIAADIKAEINDMTPEERRQRIAELLAKCNGKVDMETNNTAAQASFGGAKLVFVPD